MSPRQISIEVVDDETPLRLIEVLECVSMDREFLVEIVEAGVVSPHGPSIDEWQFARRDLRRLQRAQRLIADLQLNAAGAALVLDLLEERDALQKRLTIASGLFNER